MTLKECKGCPHLVWRPKDKLYDTPGYHACGNPDYCERYRKKRIRRDENGCVTDDGMREMVEALPIEVFVGPHYPPHRVIETKEELEKYFLGALPYVLTSHFRHKED